MPWSMPDQDEPETWASWQGRHRPPVTLNDEPLANRPEEGAGGVKFLGLVVLAVAVLWGLHWAGVI